MLLPGMAWAQGADTLRVDFHLRGLPAPHVVLGRYEAGLAYRLDSMPVDTPGGRFVFVAPKALPGQYFVASGGKNLFDFVVPRQGISFSIHGTVSPILAVQAENEPENAAYFDFERRRQAIEEKIEARQSMMEMVRQATKNDRAVMGPMEAELTGYYRSLDTLARTYVGGQPTHLYARMLQSVRPPEPPTALPAFADNKPNPAYRSWLRAHYWDNCDFRDSLLLHNYFWPSYFDAYFSRYVPPMPDSIIAAADHILARMPKHGSFYRFAVMRITQRFEMNEYPGADRVFVHMADRYQRPDDTPWLDQATLLRLEYKANAHRPVLTGNPAPPLRLQQKNGTPFALDTLQAPFTLLVFYSPLCNHCMEVMPDIYQTWLDARPSGLRAVAVLTDRHFSNWQAFTDQQHWEWTDVADPTGENLFEKQYMTNNLPALYLLDRDKKILYKRIRPEALREVLQRYLVEKR